MKRGLTLWLALVSVPGWAASECAEVVATRGGVQLKVGANHRLHFEVGDGQGFLRRLAGRALTASAKPFWLGAMSDVLEEVAGNSDPAPVFDKMLAALDIGYVTRGVPPTEIPASGALLLTAIHPRFGAEALAIGALVSKIRPDLKVVMNEQTCIVPGFPEIAVGVHMTGCPEKKAQAYAEMRSWLKAGHALLIFPAGGVSSYQPHTGNIEDHAWSRGVPLLARQTGAPILPIHSDAAEPGFTFRMLSRLRSPAQKSTYPREILRQRGQQIVLTLGAMVSTEQLKNLGDSEEAAQFLRALTYGLGAFSE